MHHLIMRRFLVSLVNYASCKVLSLHRQGQGKNVRLILKYSILTIEIILHSSLTTLRCIMICIWSSI